MAYQFPSARILIFAKAPISGTCKTRMQPFLNPKESVELQKSLTLHTINTVCLSNLAPVELWCSPDPNHTFHINCSKRFKIQLKCQTDGDLGARMHQAFVKSLATSEFTIILGIDCPSIDHHCLSTALGLLYDKTQLVIGPAQDGGYVLIGLRKPEKRLFENKAWGSKLVLEQTMETTRHLNIEYKLMNTYDDIDTPDDLYRLYCDKPDLFRDAIPKALHHKLINVNR